MNQELWDQDFNIWLKTMYGIGIEDTDPTYYRDLSPKEAALEWGNKHGLDRIDRIRIY